MLWYGVAYVLMMCDQLFGSSDTSTSGNSSQTAVSRRKALPFLNEHNAIHDFSLYANKSLYDRYMTV